MICKSFGDLNQVVLGDFPEPDCGPNDVLIKVKVATVSYMDWLVTDGRYQLKPNMRYVTGTDPAGVVQEVGSKITRFKPGDRVACSTWFGAMRN